MKSYDGKNLQEVTKLTEDLVKFDYSWLSALPRGPKHVYDLFQTVSSLKHFGQSKPDRMWRFLGKRGH